MNNKDQNILAGSINKKMLFNEIVDRRYLITKGKVQEIFKRVSIEEYIILHALSEKNKAGDGEARIYLKSIAEKMNIKTSAASKIAGKLKDKGLVVWSHEGKGDEGTYVELTNAGSALLKNQEQLLEVFFCRVFKRFGLEKTAEFLKLAKELEEVMASEYEAMEAEGASKM